MLEPRDTVVLPILEGGSEMCEAQEIARLESDLFWKTVSNKMDFFMTFSDINHIIRWNERDVLFLIKRIESRFGGLLCGE